MRWRYGIRELFRFGLFGLLCCVFVYPALSQQTLGAAEGRALPKIHKQIIELLFRTELGASQMGNPWDLGKVLGDTAERHRDRLRGRGAFDHVGRSVYWTRDFGNRFTITEAGLIGAAWNTGADAVLKYLAFRKGRNWIGQTKDFPPKRRRKFRAVEIGLLAFRNAQFRPPVATVRLRRGDFGAQRALFESLYEKAEKECPKCGF